MIFDEILVVIYIFLAFQVYIPAIKEVINPTQISRRTENEMVAALQLLVNLSVVDTWHIDMRSCIAYCLDILHMEFLSHLVKVKCGMLSAYLLTSLYIFWFDWAGVTDSVFLEGGT